MAINIEKQFFLLYSTPTETMKISCPIKSNYERSTLIDVIYALSCLVGISYGLAAYTAPNFFFGPNGGMMPGLTGTKTSLESNDLDPITEHYIRSQGVSLITLIFSYYFFAFGDLESERVLAKSFFVGHAACLAVFTMWLRDGGLGEYYESSVLKIACLWFALQMAWDVYAITSLPKPKVKSSGVPSPPSTDTVIFYACALYVGQSCASRVLLGADPTYFPNTDFDALMNVEAQLFGAWFIPSVYILLFEAQKNLRLTYKIMIICCISTLPEIMKVIHEGNGDQRAFASVFAFSAAFMALAFYRLGAFDMEEDGTEAKTEDEGMRLRDGRVISHKAQ
mmetsp:Transcript_16074/g.32335  ORF Transcript_16074/g.32335 Transcript_16074/m.32335 type:complete len:337 (-) Transcript_16074:1089-2099(-)